MRALRQSVSVTAGVTLAVVTILFGLTGCGGTASQGSSSNASEPLQTTETADPVPQQDEFEGRLLRAKFELDAGRFDVAKEVISPLLSDYSHPRFAEVLELAGKIDSQLNDAGSTEPTSSPAVTGNSSSTENPLASVTPSREDLASSPTIGLPEAMTSATDSVKPEAEGVPVASAPPSTESELSSAVEEAANERVWLDDGAVTGDKVEINQLEAERILDRTQATPRAVDALAFLERKISRVTFPERLQSKLDRELELLKEKAADDLYRNGARWESASEFDNSRKEASALYNSAVQSLRDGLLEPARDSLAKASRIYFNDIRADYLAGLICVVPGAVDLDAAKSHFSEVVTRRPDHAGALHNLGLLGVKTRNYSTAYRLWSQVAELDPRCPQLKHNIERLLRISAQNLTTINDRDLKRMQNLLPKLHDAGNSSADGMGWLFVPLAATSYGTFDRVRNSGAYYELSRRGSGTGFVVAPNLVLTNRHVVEASKGEPHAVIELALPEQDVSVHHGFVVMMAEDRDLALVEFPGLDLPVLKLAASEPRRSDEIMIFGYPLPGGDLDLGVRLKATKGVITALPEATNRNQSMLILDAVASPGNSGGPVVGEAGSVIGIVTQITSPNERINERAADYSFAIPAKDALQFVTKHLPSYEAFDATKLDWRIADELASKSTVRLTACDVETSMEFSMPQAGRYPLDDRSCPRCHGHGIDDCSHCVSGTVNEKRMVQTAVTASGAPVYSPKFFSKDCASCQGGVVPCSHCRGSRFDPNIRSIR